MRNENSRARNEALQKYGGGVGRLKIREPEPRRCKNTGQVVGTENSGAKAAALQKHGSMVGRFKIQGLELRRSPDAGDWRFGGRDSGAARHGHGDGD